ncbi:GCN5-related N-acetyltransferase [Alkaliphilus metalliredigens QYMF]|uniref:GCN5-related N-acetyltransferase n=1 Tax=Alkaliphilus metalliredigens (strain QYMF) TaxID=293826 RepID=A6TSD2_ALKMQ|nr:GNAT family N-acetyltransferase [Alkaliphilus metalliredigens]ABR49100.1 GCN5-related N-acetyltransferase [Alkaliphilus metalliredigens QYMF]
MIREFRREDKDIFVSMVKDFYNSEAVLKKISTENIMNTINEINECSPYIKCYLVEEREETAGYVLISLTYSNEASGLVVFIEEIYIREKFRGLGLGGEVLDFIKKEFSPRAKRFRLELTKNNKSAEELYLRKGFTILEYKQMIQDM